MSRWAIKPSIGRVLVKPQTEEEVSAGGIYLVYAAERETHVAEVVEVCDPYEAVATDRSIQQAGPIYAVGDLVVIGKYNGREIKIDREKFIIAQESDVLGKLVLREETPVLTLASNASVPATT